MTRMFHRALAVSLFGAVALAAPAAAALAADSGTDAAGAGGGETATSVQLHLPKHAMPGHPFTVSARIVAEDPATDDGGTGGSGGTGGAKGKGKGHGHGKGVGHGKGAGHGKGKGKGKQRHHAMTGRVVFTVDGKQQPAVAVTRGQASEKISVALGRHTISAVYSGDANYEGAQSSPITFTLSDGTGDGGGGQRPAPQQPQPAPQQPDDPQPGTEPDGQS